MHDPARAALSGSLDGVTPGAIAYSSGSAPTDAGGYTASVTVEGQTASVDFTIGKATLPPTATVNSKAYDGNTSAAGTIALSGAAGGEAPTATGTFTFTSPDVGDRTVKVTDITLDGGWDKNYQLSTDDLETTDSITARAITGTAAVSGTPTMLETLTGSYTGGAADETCSFQWLRDGAAIPGAAGTAYKLVEADVGKTINFQVTGTGNYGGEKSATAGPVAKAVPEVTAPTAAVLTYTGAATALVRNQGINKFGTLYTDYELGFHIGERVGIKWDIDDATKLYVYTADGKKICEAVSAELLALIV